MPISREKQPTLTEETKSWQLLPMRCPECKFEAATVVHYVVTEVEANKLEYRTKISCGNCDFLSAYSGDTVEGAMMNAWWRYQR